MMDYEMKADAVVTSEVAPIEAMNATVEALKSDVLALSRKLVERSAPPLRAGGGKAVSAFADGYLRKGIETDMETKRFQAGVAGDGGLAVPLEIDQRIETTLRILSPIRSVADVVKVGSSSYRKLVAIGGFASGWVSESAGRPETNMPTFVEVAPPMGEIYANPAATQQMLDDAMFDVEGWLASEIAADFARAEGVAFVAGTGISQPKGFLTYPVAVTADSARPWGTLQYVASGAAGAFVSSNPADRLIDLVHALRTPYRQGAVWLMNSATAAIIDKFKDSTGQYIWRPGMTAGAPPVPRRSGVRDDDRARAPTARR